MWCFLMRFYVMLCMILMVCICYCCFDNFQIVNFLSTTIFYYNPKISFFMMNLVWNSMVMSIKNILILWNCGSNNRVEIELLIVSTAFIILLKKHKKKNTTINNFNNSSYKNNNNNNKKKHEHQYIYIYTLSTSSNQYQHLYNLLHPFTISSFIFK